MNELPWVKNTTDRAFNITLHDGKRSRPYTIHPGGALSVQYHPEAAEKLKEFVNYWESQQLELSDKEEEVIPPSCECGAIFAGVPHSPWCPLYEE